MLMITEDEKEVAEILVQLRYLILQREVSSKKLELAAAERDVPRWAHESKRSVADDDDDNNRDHEHNSAELSQLPKTTLPHRKRPCTRPEPVDAVEASSSASYLSGQENKEVPEAAVVPAARNVGHGLGIDLNEPAPEWSLQ